MRMIIILNILLCTTAYSYEYVAPSFKDAKKIFKNRVSLDEDTLSYVQGKYILRFRVQRKESKVIKEESACTDEDLAHTLKPCGQSIEIDNFSQEEVLDVNEDNVDSYTRVGLIENTFFLQGGIKPYKPKARISSTGDIVINSRNAYARAYQTGFLAPGNRTANYTAGTSFFVKKECSLSSDNDNLLICKSFFPTILNDYREPAKRVYTYDFYIRNI